MKFRFYALWLSLICIILFILQNMINGFTELFVLNQNSYMQIWRVVTAIFLHGGLSHLVYNLFALILFGTLLEKLIGGRNFLLTFFLAGIGANIISVFFYPSSLGASGAIFGIIGTLIIVRPLLIVFAFGIPMPIIVAGILWVGGDVMGIFFPSGVGNIAHLTGMFLGLLIGAFLRDWRKQQKRKDHLRVDEGYMRHWEDHYMK